MDSNKGYERLRLPFNKVLPVSKKGFQIILNQNDNIRAEISDGVITVQTKKFKGNLREVLRVDTVASQATIELVVEEISKQPTAI